MRYPLLIPCALVCMMVVAIGCHRENANKLTSHRARLADSREERFRHTVVTLAREMQGKKYVRGGKDPRGFDCSGLIYYILKEMNVGLPGSSAEQARLGKSIPLPQARQGDLIFFGTGQAISHVGIITENTKDCLKVIHSSSSKGVIEENILKSDYWLKRIALVKDLYSYSKDQIRSYSGQ